MTKTVCVFVQPQLSYIPSEFAAFCVVNWLSKLRAHFLLLESAHITPQQTQRNEVGLMLDQRRRRWANTKPTLFQCVVFAGIVLA